MANKAVQYLKHGKALCGKVFSSFVETYNSLVDFMVNLKGDADRQDGNGHITLDRTDPLHPVIRCKGCPAADGDGSGDNDDPDEEGPEDEDPYEGGGSGDDDDGDGGNSGDGADEQDPWYKDPEDSPAPSDGGSGCNKWSGDGLQGGNNNSDGWTGDNCGSINNFTR